MTLFELLFKYPPSLFSAGSVALAPAWRFVVPAAVILAIGVPVLVHYGLLGRRPGGRFRGQRLLVVLRIAILSLVVVFLLRPSLTVSTLVPLQSFVGVLVDDSASMSVRDRNGGLSGLVKSLRKLRPMTMMNRWEPCRLLICGICSMSKRKMSCSPTRSRRAYTNWSIVPGTILGTHFPPGSLQSC